MYSLPTTCCDSVLRDLCWLYKSVWLTQLTWAQRPDCHGRYGAAASPVWNTHIYGILLHSLFLTPSFSFSTAPASHPGEMVWPFWSKQALITPWEGSVRGTAQGIWRGPHRGTWDQEIDAVGVQSVMAPYGKSTAPADEVSVSTLGKCVKDSGRRMWDFGSG